MSIDKKELLLLLREEWEHNKKMKDIRALRFKSWREYLQECKNTLKWRISDLNEERMLERLDDTEYNSCMELIKETDKVIDELIKDSNKEPKLYF